MATNWNARSSVTTSWTWRTPIQRFWSYLCDRLGNRICDRLGNPILVYDASGNVPISGTTWTWRTLI